MGKIRLGRRGCWLRRFNNCVNAFQMNKRVLCSLFFLGGLINPALGELQWNSRRFVFFFFDLRHVKMTSRLFSTLPHSESLICKDDLLTLFGIFGV